MDFTIPEELKMLQEMVRDFIKEEILPLEQQYIDAEELPEEVAAPIREKARALGLLGLGVPQEYGGAGLSELGMCLVMEERAKVTVGQSVFGREVNGILLHAGNPEQKERWLIPTMRGEMNGVWCLTEPGAGTDAAAIETAAVWDGKSYILNGSKMFVEAVGADYAIVVGRLKGTKRREGVTIFIVPTDTPGYKMVREIPMMGNSPRNRGPRCEVTFQDCAVPPECVIGKPGQGWDLMQNMMGGARVRIGALAVGIAERCLNMAIDYARQRVTFGQPIGNRQGIQWMLADSAIEIHATRLMTYDAAAKMDRGEDARQEIAMVKVFGAEMVARVVDRALQVYGGVGFTRDTVIQRYYRDIRCMRIMDGTSEIMRYVIARNLLRD